VSVSAPAPSSTDAATAAAANVTISAPAPPVRLSTPAAVSVLAPEARVSLSAPAPRSTDPPAIAVASVTVSPADPPDWKQVKAGQVIYVPLQVDHGRARGYIIYGMSKDWPINDVMRGGYGQ
jgi:hypothetical protein